MRIGVLGAGWLGGTGKQATEFNPWRHATAGAFLGQRPSALASPRSSIRGRRRATDGCARWRSPQGRAGLIDQVGAWTALAPLAQPIRRMAFYDGRTRDAVRVEQLRFGGEDDEPLAKRSSGDSRRPWFAKSEFSRFPAPVAAHLFCLWR